jgi:acetylornithine deacetylase/succinyl-diaminopimelate desuccinylase-like protein
MIQYIGIRNTVIIASLILSLILGNAFIYSQSTSGNNNLTANQKMALDLFRELIEINTTAQFGSSKAAEAMAARLRTAGFPADDIRLEGQDPQHLNLVVRYRGSGKLRPVLFICHLDVVQALRKDWSIDPFIFVEKDGYYYGRGTTDIKCEDADLIANIIRLKQEKYMPNRDIIVALTADEEGGNANGVNWLLANHRELIDAEYCINPDGGGGDMRNGIPVAMGIQTSEKIFLNFELEVKNKGGHSSLPVKENAIYRLAAGLTRLADYDFPVRLNETTKKLFEKNAAGESEQVKADMLTIIRDPSDKVAANRLSAASAYYNAMIRTTCVATMVSGGHAENALPQSAHAIINCRMLPDDSPENVLSTLKKVIADTAISVTCTYTSFLAPLSPLREEVINPIERITASMWPGITITPVMSTGATDGKYVRRAGIPVYGVSGMFGDINDVRAHGKDERIGIREFFNGVEFMYRLMKALTSESN